MDSEYIVRAYGFAVVDGSNLDLIKETGAHGITYNGNAYKSTFLIQSLICSVFYKIGIPYNMMDICAATLTALCIVIYCICISDAFNVKFGICFYFVSLLSPFLSMFAGNLFFMTFTWFVPGIIIYLIMKEGDIKSKKSIILLLSLFIALLFKCLCCYEYLSTIMIMAFTIPFAKIICDNAGRKAGFGKLIICGFAAVVAFMVALVIHSTMFEGSIIDGIKTIIKEIALRRTLGDSADFEYLNNPFLLDSLNASVFEVLYAYLFRWGEIVFPALNGNVFPVIMICSLSIITYDIIIRRDQADIKIAITYCLFFLATVSWYIIAKSHSYVHVHMNYVLWYLGFLQIAVYVIVNFITRRKNKDLHEV